MTRPIAIFSCLRIDVSAFSDICTYGEILGTLSTQKSPLQGPHRRGPSRGLFYFASVSERSVAWFSDGGVSVVGFLCAKIYAARARMNSSGSGIPSGKSSSRRLCCSVMVSPSFHKSNLPVSCTKDMKTHFLQTKSVFSFAKLHIIAVFLKQSQLAGNFLRKESTTTHRSKTVTTCGSVFVFWQWDVSTLKLKIYHYARISDNTGKRLSVNHYCAVARLRTIRRFVLTIFESESRKY